MSITPLDVAVICPTFNSAGFLRATLESVRDQTRLPREVIISDDGSTDGTVAMATAFLAETPLAGRVIANVHRGPGATRNSGIKSATSRWIAFLDSDDLWFPQKLQRVGEEIERRPEKNFFCHAEEHHTRTGRKVALDYGAWFVPDTPLPAQLMRRNLFSTSAVVCTRESLLAAGLFDERLGSSQDYEMWLRMSPEIQVGFIRETLGCYVDRPGNITSRHPLWRLRNLVRVIHRHRRKTRFPVYASALIRGLAGYGAQLLKRNEV